MKLFESSETVILKYVKQMEASFSYKASARPIQDRAKYRDDSDPTKQFCNIAVDPRIYRGSTYARRSIMTEQVQKIQSNGR